MAKDKTLGQLVTVMVDHYGGPKKEFARAVGISPSALSRLMAGHPTTPDVCLRLARVGRMNASIVLRAAGKQDLAMLIEELYGAAADQRQRFWSITPQEQTHLEEWRGLEPKVQRAINYLASLAMRASPPVAAALSATGREYHSNGRNV